MISIRKRRIFTHINIYSINKNTNTKLSFALAEVLKNLWEILTQRDYPPENFKKIISEMNPLFKGIAANDPKDLIIFLLQTIHKELNNPPNNNINNIIPNETNLIEVFNCFVNDYNNNNKSIISDEFYGYTNSSTICLSSSKDQLFKSSPFSFFERQKLMKAVLS